MNFNTMVIETLLFIFGTILVFNSIFTFILWRKSNEPILKHLFFFWLSGLTAFFLQGVFNNLELSGFIAFSVNAVSAYFLMLILYQTTKLKIPIKFFLVSTLTGFFLSFILYYFEYPFSISIFPFILGLSFVVLKTLYQVIRSGADSLQKGYLLLFLFTTIHFIDYPFLRPREDLAVVGFSISLMIFFSYSIYIPLFITKKLSERYTENLENEVRNRTLKLNLMTEELQKANSTLEKHNHLLDSLAKENESLVHILVHDISNPVQVISICNNKLIKDDLSPEEKIKTKNKVSIALESIFSIIRTVRSLHAIKNGKQELSFSEENLSKLVATILESFEIQLNEKKLTVDFQDTPADLKIKTNVDILKNQILANLISNSIKFSPENSKIKLSVIDDKDFVTLNVRDYGIGIPSELRKDLFSLSKKTSRLGTQGEKGSGFGLPLAKKYAQLIHADIELTEVNDSLPGTCFQVKFKKSS